MGNPRSMALNKWSASWAFIKARVSMHWVRPVDSFPLSPAPCTVPHQVEGRYSSFLASIAQMMRAFLLATATMARFVPRRSRSSFTHRLNRSVFPTAVLTTARAPWTSRVRRCWSPRLLRRESHPSHQMASQIWRHRCVDDRADQGAWRVLPRKQIKKAAIMGMKLLARTGSPALASYLSMFIGRKSVDVDVT